MNSRLKEIIEDLKEEILDPMPDDFIEPRRGQRAMSAQETIELGTTVERTAMARFTPRICSPPSNVEKLSSTIFSRVNIGRNECRCPKIASATRMNTMQNRVKPPTKHRESSSGRERNCSQSESRKTALIK